MDAVQTGYYARCDECRVAGHANEEQHSSAPVCTATMGYFFTEITLTQHHEFAHLWRQLVRFPHAVPALHRETDVPQ